MGTETEKPGGLPPGQFHLFVATPKAKKDHVVAIGLSQAECERNLRKVVSGGFWLPRVTLLYRYPIRQVGATPLRDLTREERRAATLVPGPWCLETNRFDDSFVDVVGVSLTAWQLCVQSALEWKRMVGSPPNTSAYWPIKINVS
jgi:hypothetical protein